MTWWLENRLRMIQNNLRDIDADMDVEQWFREIQASYCNCVMVGAGGISSFFPSELSFQTPSLYLKRDLLGEIVKICHQNGVKVIARFDFSKTHQRLLAEHPEWFYVSQDGAHLHYNDTAATCVCGAYQQEKSIEILREALQKYPVDGIFFNMFGFQTSDYSNVEHGICNCESCKHAYRAFSGKELPKGDAWKHDETYAAFKEKVVSDLLTRIRQAVKHISPQTAVCTYHHNVDVIREESNSAVDRPLPFFLYSASENCGTAAFSWAGEKTMLNCAINAVDIFYRFQGVSPEMTKLRLYQNMAAGSQLDFCIIGNFADYPDRLGVEAMREVFGFHARNEELYGHLQSYARVLLYRPDKKDKEYLGWYNLLKEAHVQFDSLDHFAAQAHPDKTMGHDVLIVPAPQKVPKELIRSARQNGLCVLYSALVDDSASEAVSELDAEYLYTQTNTRASYVSTADKERFPSFPERDWVLVDREFGVFRAQNGGLNLVHAAMFGPPERCFGHQLGEEKGLLFSPDGMTAAFTFRIGQLYRDYGYADHKQIALDVLRAFVPSAFAVLDTNAPSCVEIFLQTLPDGRTLLQLINLSGFNGVTMEKCIPIHDVQVTLPMAVNGVTPVDSAPAPQWQVRDGNTQLHLPPLGRYQAYVLE